MTILVLQTQVYENYGNEDQPYWKAKGGSDIKVTGVPLNLSRESINALARMVEVDNPYMTETVVDWSFQPDDYLSVFEQDQLEFDGTIRYREPTVAYEDLVNSMIAEEA